MNKKSKICLGLVSCLIGILSFSSVFAQQALPAGGSSFETAVPLAPGSYQGSLAEDEAVFYCVQASPGQQIKIETDSNDMWLSLSNDQNEELQFGGSDKFVYWLPNSEKSTHSLYLKASNEVWETVSFTLQVSSANYYDANSQTDAGDSFEKSLDITTGQYQGYLAGYYDLMTPKGDDFKDYYKVPVKKGITYTFKVTPPSTDGIDLSLFSPNRELLDENSSANPGAIVNLSLIPTANTDIFVLVGHEAPISGEVLSYKLNIGTSTPLTKFYTCEEGSCELIGEFVSKEDCQTSTAKTCHQTESCDGECAGIIIPDGYGKLSFGVFSFFKNRSWLFLIAYAYLAICLQVLAKKTSTPNGWFAWIPVANIFLMLQIAQKPLWWFILLLIPIVNIITGIIIWMKIAERRGKPNWMGILLIVPVVGIAVPGYLAFFDNEKKETTPPYVATGTESANKPTVGYKHPCKYCNKLVPPNSAVCPFCGKVNPLGPYRCPKCHEPIEKEWQVCPRCNQNLRIVCPFCKKVTFFGDNCEDCGARLLVKCPNCGQEQPPISDKCIKCDQPLEKSNK
jgi:hypothetical protein